MTFNKDSFEYCNLSILFAKLKILMSSRLLGSRLIIFSKQVTTIYAPWPASIDGDGMDKLHDDTLKHY